MNDNIAQCVGVVLNPLSIYARSSEKTSRDQLVHDKYSGRTLHDLRKELYDNMSMVPVNDPGSAGRAMAISTAIKSVEKEIDRFVFNHFTNAIQLNITRESDESRKQLMENNLKSFETLTDLKTMVLQYMDSIKQEQNKSNEQIEHKIQQSEIDMATHVNYIVNSIETKCVTAIDKIEKNIIENSQNRESEIYELNNRINTIKQNIIRSLELLFAGIVIVFACILYHR